MNRDADNQKLVCYSRRRMLAAVTAAGVGSIAGCSGTGGDAAENDADATDDTDSTGDAGGSSTDSGSEDGSTESPTETGDGCPQWSSLSPYDVSETDFAVIPSFPTEWTQYNETYIESFVEIRCGYPGSVTDDGVSYPDHIAITQVTSTAEKDTHEPVIEQGLYERDDPVVIDGEEFVVGREVLNLTTRWHLTVPSPDDTYHITTVEAETARESCFETLSTAGRAVVDSLEVNPETTL